MVPARFGRSKPAQSSGKLTSVSDLRNREAPPVVGLGGAIGCPSARFVEATCPLVGVQDPDLARRWKGPSTATTGAWQHSPVMSERDAITAAMLHTDRAYGDGRSKKHHSQAA